MLEDERQVRSALQLARDSFDTNYRAKVFGSLVELASRLGSSIKDSQANNSKIALLEDNLRDKERQIGLLAKNDLEKGRYTLAVLTQLRASLQREALNMPLSPQALAQGSQKVCAALRVKALTPHIHRLLLLSLSLSSAAESRTEARPACMHGRPGLINPGKGVNSFGAVVVSGSIVSRAQEEGQEQGTAQAGVSWRMD